MNPLCPGGKGDHCHAFLYVNPVRRGLAYTSRMILSLILILLSRESVPLFLNLLGSGSFLSPAGHIPEFSGPESQTVKYRLHPVKCADPGKSDLLQDLLGFSYMIAQISCGMGVGSYGQDPASQVAVEAQDFF